MQDASGASVDTAEVQSNDPIIRMAGVNKWFS